VSPSVQVKPRHQNIPPNRRYCALHHTPEKEIRERKEGRRPEREEGKGEKPVLLKSILDEVLKIINFTESQHQHRSL
jgi:hypothetical protein